MNHLVIPLDPSHVVAFERLVALIGGGRPASNPPHITVVAYEGLSPDAARDALMGALADVPSFVVHAHGYGVFTGTDPGALSLHVPVVRDDALGHLHHRMCDVVRRAGGCVATWCEADLWSPHITLRDRDLDARRLGAAVTVLAERHHPSWELLVDRVESWAAGTALTGGLPAVLLGAQPRTGSTAPNQ